METTRKVTASPKKLLKFFCNILLVKIPTIRLGMVTDSGAQLQKLLALLYGVLQTSAKVVGCNSTLEKDSHKGPELLSNSQACSAEMCVGLLRSGSTLPRAAALLAGTPAAASGATKASVKRGSGSTEARKTFFNCMAMINDVA